jgi:hypothetical protein
MPECGPEDSVAKGVDLKQNLIRRHSKGEIEIGEVGNYRRQALAKIPFSSIFYCSNPLAAALTRKRTQIFFFLLAALGNLTEFWPAQLFEDLSLQRSLQIRFNGLERRGGRSAKISCISGPGISSLGITQNEKPISSHTLFEESENSMTISFDQPTMWNGWYFVTSDASPECDPVKFSLEAFDGSKWKTVGSSMAMQVTQETVFLHGHFETSRVRGARHDFHVLAPSFFGYFAVRFLGDIQGISIALCGWLGRERLGAQLPNVQASLFVLSMLIATCFTHPSKGDYSVVPHLYFGMMQGGALYFQLRHQWLLCSFWTSSCLIILGALLAPYAPEPAIHVISVGGPWLIAGICVRIFSWWTTRSARLSIADDQRFYDALWALVLDHPESRAAAADLDALLAAEARRRLPAPPAVDWDLTFSLTRHRIPRPRAGGIAGLLGGGSYGILADLEALYAQAEAAYEPFQRKVLALAAQCRGFLPVAHGSVIGRGEGMELAAAAAAATGVVRVGSASSDYCMVGPESRAEGFRWAALKGVERALEKVGGRGGSAPDARVSVCVVRNSVCGRIRTGRCGRIRIIICGRVRTSMCGGVRTSLTARADPV